MPFHFNFILEDLVFVFNFKMTVMDNDYIKEKSKEENLLNILKVKCIN